MSSNRKVSLNSFITANGTVSRDDIETALTVVLVWGAILNHSLLRRCSRRYDYNSTLRSSERIDQRLHVVARFLLVVLEACKIAYLYNIYIYGGLTSITSDPDSAVRTSFGGRSTGLTSQVVVSQG